MWTKYGKIARDLREAISRGDYAPGSTLPALPQLMEKYGVARDTVREAITALANEGIVTPKQGIGTVVRDTGGAHLNSTRTTAHPTWTETTGSAGRVELVEAEHVTADTEIAERLGIPAGSDVTRRVKHYYVGRDVVLMHEQWIPKWVSSAITASSGYDPGSTATEPSDIYSLMKQSGSRPNETRETVTCRMPDPQERDAMSMPPGVPVQMIKRTTTDKHGKPLETSDFAACGDRASATYTVTMET